MRPEAVTPIVTFDEIKKISGHFTPKLIEYCLSIVDSYIPENAEIIIKYLPTPEETTKRDVKWDYYTSQTGLFVAGYIQGLRESRKMARESSTHAIRREKMRKARQDRLLSFHAVHKR